MSERIVRLSDSVYSLCTQYPELKELMVQLGFSDIVKPGMLSSVGRLMTLPKGAKMRKIDLAQIKARLEAEGFVVVD